VRRNLMIERNPTTGAYKRLHAGGVVTVVHGGDFCDGTLVCRMNFENFTTQTWMVRVGATCFPVVFDVELTAWGGPPM
jgi:hypothetical protein